VAKAVPLRPRPAGGEIDAEARLAFLDRLMSEPGEASSARLALRLLAEHLGIERGLCAVAEPGGGSLAGLASLGVSEAAVARFKVDLEDRRQLLAAALESMRPVVFVPGQERRGWPATPLGRVPFHAIPMTRFDGQEEPALGLLLLHLPGHAVTPPLASWTARQLGVRLRALRYRTTQLALRRVGEDRRRLQGVLDAVTDPILLTDADGRMLVANAGAERLFSADEADSEGRRRAVALNNMLFSASLLAATAAPGRRELLLVDPREGHDLLFELLATPTAVRRGETGVVAILRDVTDLHRASEEIEESYQRLRRAEAEARAGREHLDLLLNAVVEPVLVTDPQGNIIIMNPPAERLFSVRSGEGADRAGLRRVAANDAVFSSFLANLATDQATRWRSEVALVDPGSGQATPVEAIAGKVLSSTGEETATVTILHDLSEAMEKRRLYEQVKRHSEELRQRVREATGELAQQNELLRRQALQLEQASAMKSQFLANISHELRTPLNAIIGYTHLLLEGVAGALGEGARERLRRVDSNARHLLSIINDLLDLTRIESGKMPVELESFTLRDIVGEVTAEMEPLIEKSGLALEVEVEPAELRVESDRKKVKQILVNLLSNALKFTPAGRVAVRAGAEPGERWVAVAVSDTGVGIPEDHQTRIFEVFAHGAASGGTGPASARSSGLGLSICRRLASLLGGEIGLESRVGEGSTFTLRLPRRARGQG
jgi:PAS domain S-box-containing protein